MGNIRSEKISMLKDFFNREEVKKHIQETSW